MATIRVHKKATIDKEFAIYNVVKLELKSYLDEKIEQECPVGYHYKKTVKYRICRFNKNPYMITAYVRVRFEKNKN